jgi:hypothetical protein
MNSERSGAVPGTGVTRPRSGVTHLDERSGAVPGTGVTRPRSGVTHLDERSGAVCLHANDALAERSDP